MLGFEAAGTVDAVGPGVTGTSTGDGVTALLFGLGGYAEYAVASIWTRKPDTVSWIDAAALPSSAEAAVGVLRQLNVNSGETLLLFGGGGSVGIIATQLAVARGVKVISAVGEHDETLARELGATPVRYGAGVAGRVRALGPVDAVFDAAGKGVLADAIALAGGPERVITLSDPAAADFGVTLSQPTPDRAPGALDETIALLADGRLRLRAHTPCPCSRPPRPTASWKAAPSMSASSSPSTSASGTAAMVLGSSGGRDRLHGGRRRAASDRANLHVGFQDPQWTLTSYTLTLASLILLAGLVKGISCDPLRASGFDSCG